jgi:type IV pilus assembly protein PilO
MLRNFNLFGGLSLHGAFSLNGAFKDPRVGMRALIGLLLLVNLVMAGVAYHPFGGSADDLARQQAAKEAQLTAMNQRLRGTRQLVEKVQLGRQAGDEFLSKYFMDRRTTTSDILTELQRIATESGINLQMQNFQFEEVEGSDTIKMLGMQVGCEGTYPNLTKFVSLLDKSPRFLIIEHIQAAAVQNGQKLNVTFKIDTFTIDRAGADS